MNETVDNLQELPQGWVTTYIADICKVQGGFAFKSTEYEESGIPLIRISNIQNGKVVIDKETVFIDGSKNEDYSDYYLIRNDILIALSGATTGKYGIFDIDEYALLNQRVGRLQPNKSCTNTKLVYYYLGIIKDNILAKAYGAAQPNISTSELSQFTFPLPPLPEQHRIVSKIEELFTKLDVAVDELKKAKAQIKRYRQSVLKHAFEGKLTEEWRKQTSNVKGETAEELLAKIKEERKKVLGKKYKELPPVDTTNLPKLPEGWVWTQLDCVCKKIQDGTHFSPKVQYKDKLPATYPYVTAKNIKEYGLDLSDITYIEQELHKTIYNRCNPEFGDILLTKDGAKTGVAALNTLDEEFSLLSSVALLKPNKNILFNKFLLFYLKSEIGLQMILGKMTGVAIKRIILEKINNSVIPIACLDEQIIISNEIERHFSVADETEKIIDQSLKQAERLRQSILKDAFSGKLVPQDPSDPPASLLLEKIKAEKEKLAKEPKRKSRTGEPAEKLLGRIKVERQKISTSSKQ